RHMWQTLLLPGRGDHRLLPAFPTRRSSDLPAGRRRFVQAAAILGSDRLGKAQRVATRVASPARSRSRNPSKQGRVDVIRRSEIGDRKSTRLNSSHVKISYAVFCLKKKRANR